MVNHDKLIDLLMQIIDYLHQYFTNTIFTDYKKSIFRLTQNEWYKIAYVCST